MAEVRRNLLIALALVAAVAGLYWLVEQLPWRYEQIDNGFDEEARRNPFLAAELFLRQQGVAVSSARGLSRLDELPPPAGATLLIHSSEGILNEAQTERLWQWIEAGGHLIMNVEHSATAPEGEGRSPLLQRLGVTAHPADGEEEGRFVEMPMLFPQRQQECPAEEPLLAVEFESEAEPLRLALRSATVLEAGGDFEAISAADESGARLMRLFVDGGQVTLLTGMGFWSNSRIACHDHAYFLWKMVEDGEVLILSHAQVPSLFTLLWQKAALAVTLALALLLAWLWRRGRRFGPLLPAAEGGRRSLIEHLHASAMFAWRNRAIAPLIERQRRGIRARMILRHPGYRRLPRPQQYALIAEAAAVDAAEVAQALEQEIPAKPQALTVLVQRLQQIRNRL